jgi:hypothetical protein
MKKSELEDENYKLKKENASLKWKVATLNSIDVMRLTKEEYQEMKDKKNTIESAFNEKSSALCDLEFKERRINGELEEKSNQVEGLINLLIKLTDKI